MSNIPEQLAPKCPRAAARLVLKPLWAKAQLRKQITSCNVSASDLHSSQSSHLSSGGPGGGWGGGCPAEQHARVRDHPADLYGHSGVCRRQICQQAGPGFSGLCHSLHPGCLRRCHQDRRRSSSVPVSASAMAISWKKLICDVFKFFFFLACFQRLYPREPHPGVEDIRCLLQDHGNG